VEREIAELDRELERARHNIESSIMQIEHLGDFIEKLKDEREQLRLKLEATK
jgi:predicted  nucleic acid-binding Zn-ribbon protein